MKKIKEFIFESNKKNDVSVSDAINEAFDNVSCQLLVSYVWMQD